MALWLRALTSLAGDLVQFPAPCGGSTVCNSCSQDIVFPFGLLTEFVLSFQRYLFPLTVNLIESRASVLVGGACL